MATENTSKTFARGLEVVASFLESPTMSFREIVQKTGLHRSICHRLVNTLLQQGYLVRDGDANIYRLGPDFIRLGARAQQALLTRSLALPLMMQLARESGTVVNLNLLDRRSWVAICVESVDGIEGVRYSMSVGGVGLLHAGATRKVILAHLTPEEREAAIALHGLARLTPNTCVDMVQLEEQLADVRRKGWCVTYGESDEGSIGCAVPLKIGPSGPVLGSLGAIGTKVRMNNDTIAHVLKVLLDAAANVNDALKNRSFM